MSSSGAATPVPARGEPVDVTPEKSSGNQPKATGMTASPGRGPQAPPHSQLNIRSR